MTEHLEIEESWEPKIYKELVIALAIFAKLNNTGETIISTEPITSTSSYFSVMPTNLDDMHDIEGKDVGGYGFNLVTIIPIPYPTYQVWGNVPDYEDEFSVLGYQFPGLPEQDWHQKMAYHVSFGYSEPKNPDSKFYYDKCMALARSQTPQYPNLHYGILTHFEDTEEKIEKRESESDAHNEDIVTTNRAEIYNQIDGKCISLEYNGKIFLVKEKNQKSNEELIKLVNDFCDAFNIGDFFSKED